MDVNTIFIHKQYMQMFLRKRVTFVCMRFQLGAQVRRLNWVTGQLVLWG